MATIIELPPQPKRIEDKTEICFFCKCKFSYGDHDVTKESKSLDGGWGGTGIQYIVKCPKRGSILTVATDYMPPR